MEESQKALEEMKKALSDNDTHIQLSNLERRWQVSNQTDKRQKKTRQKKTRQKDERKRHPQALTTGQKDNQRPE